MANLSTGRRMVTIDLHSQLLQDQHRQQQQQQQQQRRRLQQRTTVCLEGAVSVRRVASKSHPYAFAVQAGRDVQNDGGSGGGGDNERQEDDECDDDDDDDDDYASIHLSGYSETDSQRWMKALRFVLRNSETSSPPLPAGVGESFETSLIEWLGGGGGHDFVGRRRRMLAEQVGHLLLLDTAIRLTSLEDASFVLAELPAEVVERAVLVQNAARPEDKEKIFFILLRKSSGGSAKGRLRFYSEKAKDIVARLSDWQNRGEHSPNENACVEKVDEFDSVKIDRLPVDDDESECDHRQFESIEEDGFQSGSGIRGRKSSSASSATSSAFNRRMSNGQTKNAKSSLNRRVSRSDTDLCYENLGRPQLTITGCDQCPSTDIKVKTEEFPNGSGGDIKLLKPSDVVVILDDKRPLSQVSNDSGVIMTMNQSDEATTSKVIMRRAAANLTLPVKQSKVGLRPDATRRQRSSEDGPAYRKFTDFLQSPDLTLYENLPDNRLSTSSDSTIYSEIDISGGGGGGGDDDDGGQDNLYEDLDKFRKNIHKLLGIPLDVSVPNVLPTKATSSQTLDAGQVQSPVVAAAAAKDVRVPPPLPPRGYKNRASLSNDNLAASSSTWSSGSGGSVVAPHVRRKDVMKYLGASADDDNDGGGNLSPASGKKHKNIYQYLGIPLMALSQPVGLNRLAAYDTLPARKRSSTATNSYKNNNRSSLTLSGPPLSFLTSSSSSSSRKSSSASSPVPVVQRKCSRTYVRVTPKMNPADEQKLAPNSCLMLPTKSNSSAAATDGGGAGKSSKKKRITFLRRKMSKDHHGSRKSATIGGSVNSGCTYVSYDIYRAEDWRDIGVTSAVSTVDKVASRCDFDDEVGSTIGRKRNSVEPVDAIAEECSENGDGDGDGHGGHGHGGNTGEQVDEDAQEEDEEEEHYCVPRTHRIQDADDGENRLYANLAALQLDDKQGTSTTTVATSTTTSTRQPEIYLEMGMSSARTSSDTSEYMDPLSLCTLPMSLDDGSTSASGPADSLPVRPPPPHPPVRKQSNPLAILESVISCIDELRAIYVNKVPQVPEVLTVREDIDGNESDATSTSTSSDVSSREDDGRADRDPSANESQIVVADDDDDGQTCLLRRRLSSYVDELFSPQNMGLEVVVAAAAARDGFAIDEEIEAGKCDELAGHDDKDDAGNDLDVDKK